MTSDKNSPWWHSSVVYQIYPRSFFDSNGDGIGDLNGITMKLDYLKLLGVDIIWLSPIYDSPNYDNGYDIRDYQKIMTEFGTMHDFDNLLLELKQRHLKLVMDLVVNHTSDEHPWFIESRKSKENPYRNFYHWCPGKNGRPPNRWGAFFGGSTWTYDETTDEYYLHTFTEKQPDLNWANPTVREEVYKIMRWWLDKGVDGFRMDVINFISKTDGYPEGVPAHGTNFTKGAAFFINGPHLHEYLQEMNEKVLRHYDVITVGECPGANVNDAQLFSSPERRELNMIFTFEHMNLDGGKFNMSPLVLHRLKQFFTLWQKGLHGKGWNSLYWNNHDQPRIVSRWGNDSPTYRVLSAKMLATCLHFLCGTPYIYQGEEIGMTNVRFSSLSDYRDIETMNFHRDALRSGLSEAAIMARLHASSRDNARTPMQWSADLPYAGFTNGHVETNPWINVNDNFKEINVAQALDDPDSIFYYYQKLIEFRRKLPVIVYGQYETLHKEDPNIFIYQRFDNEAKQCVIVACNFQNQLIVIDDDKLENQLKQYRSILISNYDQINKTHWLKFRPYEAWALDFSK